MPKVSLTFKDADVQRAVRAARKAGLNPTGVTINTKTGEITVTAQPLAEAPRCDEAVR